MSDFYILLGDQESGPFELRELEEMIRRGEIPADTLYARPGMGAWEPVCKVIPSGVKAGPRSVAVAADRRGEGGPGQEDFPFAYADGGFEKLMREFAQLSSYAEVDRWDAKAKEEIKKIVAGLRGLDHAIAKGSTALAQARREFEERSFLKRAFGSHYREEAIAAQLSSLRQRKTRLLQMAAQLQEAVDFTPNTSAEKELLVKELRHRKKELQAERREATAAMASIRQQARVQSVHAGKNWIGLYDSELAAGQRRGIRYAKEAALRPHEDTKAAIDRQLIKIEKDLLWVERFE
ncbi:MAG TPA: DUF4339 domain-containing protein [Verrucomicrobiae bacterium]